MKFLKSITIAVAIAAGAMRAVPAFAHVAVGVSVRFPPPPARVERVAVWPGHVWIAGYWRWNGARHVWVVGHWAYARPGYRYVPAHWVHTGPVWRFHAGCWIR
jgi:hypothetical protein